MLKWFKAILVSILLIIGLVPVKYFSQEDKKVKDIIGYEWLKEIPDYIKYFKPDHQIIINTIGIDTYFILFENFDNSGIYFINSNDSKNGLKLKITSIIGEENYNKLHRIFKSKILYMGNLNQLKKIWLKDNRGIENREAARILQVSERSIYNWRKEVNA